MTPRLEDMARAAADEAVARAQVGAPVPAHQQRMPMPTWFNTGCVEIMALVPPENGEGQPTPRPVKRVMLQIYTPAGETTVFLEADGATALAKVLTDAAAEARSGLTVVRG